MTRRTYTERGYQYVANAVPMEVIERLRRDLLSAINCQLIAHKVSWLETAPDLDSRFNVLCAANRKLGGYVFDIARELPSFLDLVRHPKLLNFTRRFMGWQMIHLPWGLMQLRIDRPGEDRGFDWHFDRSYNATSEDAVTLWLPLTDIEDDMGPLQIVPGSHRVSEIVIAKRSYEPRGQDNREIYRLPEARCEGFEAAAISLPVKAGDALMLHGKLIHKSGVNRSNKARWVAIVRMSNLLDPEFMARGWAHCRPNKPQTMTLFQTLHPEVCITEEREHG